MDIEQYINELTGCFASYNAGLSDESTLVFDCLGMGDYYALWCRYNQERHDKGFGLSLLSFDLLYQLSIFLYKDKVRFSGMDLDKGFYNNMDSIHLEARKWIDVGQLFMDFEVEQIILSNEQLEETAHVEVKDLPNEILFPIPEPKQQNIIKLLERLKHDGWITKTATGYRWRDNVTNQLIAYWVERVSINYKLSNTYINEKIAICWKPFEHLFGLNDGTLKNAKANWMRINTKFEPTDFDKIEPYTSLEE